MKVGGAKSAPQTPANPKPAKHPTPQQPISQIASSDGGQPAPTTIVVKCPSGHQLKVKPELAGKQARCPKCKQAFTIAKPASLSAPTGMNSAPIQPTHEPPAPSTTTGQETAAPTQSGPHDPLAPGQQTSDPLFSDPLNSDPFSADPLSAEPGGQVGGAGDFGDASAFDDATGFGDAPAFDDGQGFDNLPAIDADPLAAPDAPANIGPGGDSATAAQQSPTGTTPTAPVKPAKPRSANPNPTAAISNSTAALPWGALAGGLTLGLVLLAAEGFVLFGLGSNDPVAVAESTNTASSLAPQSQPVVADTASRAEPEEQPESTAIEHEREMRQEEQTLATTEREMQRDQPDQRGGDSPILPSLAEVKSDESPYTLGGSGGARKLPTNTYSIAYDEPTGRIALTLDRADRKRGAVAVYEMDNILDGPGEPVATFETPGLPTAVVIKPWKGKRLFAVACNRSQEVWLYDVDTLEPAGQLRAGGAEIIDIQDLGSSSDPNDPFLYFAALESYKRYNSTSKDNVVGRLDLSTMKLDSKTKPPQPGQKTTEPDGRVAVSADGSTLFGIEDSYRYEKVPGEGTLGQLTSLHNVDRYYGALPTPGPFGAQTLASFNLCSRDLFVTDKAGLLLLAAGRQNAILLGVEKVSSNRSNNPAGRIKIISANNYKEHASADFRYGIFNSQSSGDSAGRFRGRLWGFLDETRNKAIIATNGSLLVWRDLLKDVPKEPWLTALADFPDQLSVGKEISIPLRTPSGGEVTYELIDESPYYVEEEKEKSFAHQVSYRNSLTFAPFATYSIPDDITLTGSFDIFVMLQTPDGKWTRQYTTKEVTFQDANEDGKVDRTDDESNPDRQIVEIETVTANNDMTVTFKPISDAIRPTLERRLDGIGRVSQYTRARPVRVAVCVAQRNDRSEITPITKVATVNVVVSDSAAALRDRRSGLRFPKPKPPLQNRLSSNDFRRNTKFVSAEDSSIKIEGNTLTWTPNARQVGKLSLGIRARSGDLVKETYYGVNVALGGSNDAEELPFYVNGISFQRDSDLAVVWGNDSGAEVTWEYNRKTSKPKPGAKYLIGIYDWRQGKVLRHSEVPLEIDFAAISPSGICATVSNPPQLVRFDHQTLKPLKQVPLKTHALRIVVVADKYVATTANLNGERFELPSLKSIQPEIPATSTWLAEDFGHGWMWEGVHWDKPMREAKLLAMPIAFGVAPDRNRRGHILGFERVARMESSGPVLLTIHDSQAAQMGLPLPIYPSRLSVKREGAAVIGELELENGKEERKVIIPSSQAANPNARGSSPLMVAHGPEHSATIVDGKIRLIPYSLWELPEVGFNFEPVQSTFLLNPSRPTDVQYSAPDAVKYHLRLMSGYTTRHGGSSISDGNAKVLFKGESTDGSFQIAFESIEPLVAAARKITGIDGNSYRNLNRNLSEDELKKKTADTLAAYRKQVTGTYRSLTGRAPRKTPVPIYAFVSAENAAGEKAALFHAYLVDVDASNPAKR